MAVEALAHITSPVLQESAVLRRTKIWCGTPYALRKAVVVKGHNGDEIRLSLQDLGTALRILKVSATDLGYARP